MSFLDINVKDYLHHRDPFLFIDGVKSVDIENKTLHAGYHVPKDLSFLKGHFPELPILPGVIAQEVIFQAGSICHNYCVGHCELVFLAKAEMKIMAPIFPGDNLDVFTTLKPGVGHFQSAVGSIKIGDEKVMEVKYLLAAGKSFETILEARKRRSEAK